jgi:hypothetical protein
MGSYASRMGRQIPISRTISCSSLISSCYRHGRLKRLRVPRRFEGCLPTLLRLEFGVAGSESGWAVFIRQEGREGEANGVTLGSEMQGSVKKRWISGLPSALLTRGEPTSLEHCGFPRQQAHPPERDG